MKTQAHYEFNPNAPLFRELDDDAIACPACHFEQPAEWNGEPANFCIHCAEPLQIPICPSCGQRGTHEDQSLYYMGNYCPWCAVPVIKPADQA